MKQLSPTPKSRGSVNSLDGEVRSIPLDAPAALTQAAAPIPAESVLAESVMTQAAELDAIFLALARRVVVDDDPAAELSLRQLRVCMALYEGPRSMSVLSRELGFSLSAMTQMADRLERAGLVTRGFEGTDRRVRKLRLTPRARRMLRLRQEARIRRAAEVLEHMSAPDRTGVLAALETLRHAAIANSVARSAAAGANGAARLVADVPAAMRGT